MVSFTFWSEQHPSETMALEVSPQKELLPPQGQLFNLQNSGMSQARDSTSLSSHCEQEGGLATLLRVVRGLTDTPPPAPQPSPVCVSWLTCEVRAPGARFRARGCGISDQAALGAADPQAGPPTVGSTGFRLPCPSGSPAFLSDV